MTAGLTPYPEYKDSGLPWLGEIPKDWEMMKMKYLFRERSEKGYPDQPLLAATQTMGVVRKEHYENRTVLALKDLHLLKLVRIGDFVISLRSFQGGIEYAHYQGIISPAYTVLCPSQQVNPKYFTALLKSKPYIDNLSIFVTGIRQGQNIDYERLSRSFLPIPMFEEQETIGTFVTHANHRINRLIHDKQRLIELLNEQKKAINHRAVTRGLDPNIRLKPSGIDWLGDVPEHWEVRRVKSLSMVKRGASPRPIDNSKYFDDQGEYAWVRIADVTASIRYLEKTTQRLSALGKSLSVPIEPGGLFLSIAGSVGKPIITKIKCCIHDGFVYFPNFKDDAEFLFYVFSSGIIYGGLGKIGTQLNLNTETVGNISIGWPPSEEQGEIVKYLDIALDSLNDAIERVYREIYLLREYRTRLIADVVTGKLDVREVELLAMEEALNLEDIDIGEDAEVEELIEIEEVADADE